MIFLVNPNNEEHSSLIHIRNVWNFNLDDEFAYIRRLVNDYRFVIFDTEFPGVVLPANESYNKDDCHYKNITDNVNVLKPIQIGICMMNEKGELPPGGPVWQFNFHFNPQTDLHAVDSLDLLKKSGFNFEKHWVSSFNMIKLWIMFVCRVMALLLKILVIISLLLALSLILK